jgi:8-oxo-dGTP pyrophosphatase MutT (NUDIX family)
VGPEEPAQPGEDLPLTLDFAALRTRLAARPRQTFDLPGHRRAAVLVPLVERDGELRVVLTLRSAALRQHGGQWSFPGGRTDESDAHASATAVREAEEEIGLDPSAVEVLGLLGDVPTPTGYLITPVVARVAPAPARYQPSASEVAEVLEVELARIGQPVVRGEVERWGHVFPLIAFELEGRTVWGATARILAELMVELGAVTTG